MGETERPWNITTVGKGELLPKAIAAVPDGDDADGLSSRGS
jgi:hypothetical protein